MLNKDHPILHPPEQTRMILAGALVATAITSIQMLPPILDNLVIGFVKIILLISVSTGFLYILLTAALLKFSKNNEIGSWPFTEKFRRKCYDYCIDTYGIQLGSVILFGSAYVFGWNFEKSILDWRIGLGTTLSLSLYAFVLYVVRYRNR